MSSSDAVFLIVSVSIVFAFTGVMIWSMRRRIRILRELAQLLRDAEAEQDDEKK